MATCEILLSNFALYSAGVGRFSDTVLYSNIISKFLDIFFIHFPFPLPLVSRCRQKEIAGFEVIRGRQGGESPEIRLDLDVAHRACRAIHPRRGGVRTRSERKLRRRRARRASVLPASWGVRRRRGGSRTELRRTLVPCIVGGGYVGAEEADALMSQPSF